MWGHADRPPPAAPPRPGTRRLSGCDGSRPRQSGKTTLARLVTERRRGVYTTLDDDATREAALNDPMTFLAEQEGMLTVDEIQMGGDRVVRAIKQLVDADPTPGRFLLTGSTNFLTAPTSASRWRGGFAF